MLACLSVYVSIQCHIYSVLVWLCCSEKDEPSSCDTMIPCSARECLMRVLMVDLLFRRPVFCCCCCTLANLIESSDQPACVRLVGACVTPVGVVPATAAAAATAEAALPLVRQSW